MRSAYYPKDELLHILGALMPCNRLACEISLATGLRINDVLSIPTDKIKGDGRFTVYESKTGKTKAVRLTKDLLQRCQLQSGKFYVFENRLNSRKHRTRQAVFKDIKRAAKAFRIDVNVVPHSMRKVYAAEMYKKCGDFGKVQKLLNHSSEAVTMLYCLSYLNDKKNRG